VQSGDSGAGGRGRVLPSGPATEEAAMRKRANRDVCAAQELACRQIIVTNGDSVCWQGPDARPAAEVPWIRRLEEGE